MRSKILLLLLSSALVCSALSWNSSPADADLLDREISELQAAINAQYSREQQAGSAQQAKKEKLLGSADYACTNGKNPAYLTNKEYLAEFARGPCTPLIVLAGVAGTKLQIEINCLTLKANHPDIFRTCLWTTCESFSLGTKPKEEYTIWLPDLISSFSLINPTTAGRTCFSSLFGLYWSDSNGKLITRVIQGVKISPMGMTPKTSSSSRCGFDSISNLLPVYNILNPAEYKAFEKLRLSLEAKGYKTGLTLQALPYDWRHSIKANQVSAKLEGMLKRIFEITGKKVSIAAHSFGNMNALHVLNKMSQADKDTYVKRFFALAPPFLGSPTAAEMMIGGDDKFYFLGLGVNFWMIKNSISKFPGFYDLMPRRTWSLYQDTFWMKSVMNRIEKEVGLKEIFSIPAEEDIVAQIFPSENSVCYTNDWRSKTDKCVTGMKNMHRLGSINGEAFTVDNLHEMLGKYSFQPLAPQLLNKAARDLYDPMDNPGVEVVIVFSTLIDTPKEYMWYKDPKPAALREDAGFIRADYARFSLGDETVLSASALIPGFKWASEFSKKLPGSKPVIFAEVCGARNRKSVVFQTANRSVEKNEYQGMDCKCKKGTEAGCGHLSLISDQNTVDYIASSLMDGQVARSPRYFDSKTEETVNNFVDRCSILNEVL